MIKLIKAYQAADGSTHDTLEKAQERDLYVMLADETAKQASTQPSIPDAAMLTLFVKSILMRRDNILDILTTKPTSRPQRRKVNGGTRKTSVKVAGVNGEAKATAA